MSGLKQTLYLGGLAFLAHPVMAQSQGLTNPNKEQWRGIAKLRTLQIHNKRYSMRAQYPAILGRSRFADFTNSQLRRFIIADFQRFRQQADKDLKDVDLAHPPAWLPFKFDSSAVLSLYRPGKLLSLVISNPTQTAGMHGMENTTGFTFTMINGQPKRLYLKDLFTPGTQYHARVEKLLISKMKRERLGYFSLPDMESGNVVIPNAQLNNFTVEKDGVRWIFNPYEMGAYGDGTIMVTLSPAELGTGLRKTLLWPATR